MELGADARVDQIWVERWTVMGWTFLCAATSLLEMPDGWNLRTKSWTPGRELERRSESADGRSPPPTTTALAAPYTMGLGERLRLGAGSGVMVVRSRKLSLPISAIGSQRLDEASIVLLFHGCPRSGHG